MHCDRAPLGLRPHAQSISPCFTSGSARNWERARSRSAGIEGSGRGGAASARAGGAGAGGGEGGGGGGAAGAGGGGAGGGAGARRAIRSARNTRTADANAAVRITRNSRSVTSDASAGGITPSAIANRISTVSVIPRPTVAWRIRRSRAGSRHTLPRAAVEGARDAKNTAVNATAPTRTGHCTPVIVTRIPRYRKKNVRRRKTSSRWNSWRPRALGEPFAGAASTRRWPRTRPNTNAASPPFPSSRPSPTAYRRTASATEVMNAKLGTPRRPTARAHASPVAHARTTARRSGTAYAATAANSVTAPGEFTRSSTNTAATMFPTTPSTVRVNRVRSATLTRGRKLRTIVALGPQNARARITPVVDASPRP